MPLPDSIRSALNPDGCIVLTFGARLGVGFRSTCPKDGLMLEGRSFIAYRPECFFGFFDWMRNRYGRLCAVRLWSFEEFEHVLLDAVRDLSYVIADDGYITVHFVEDNVFDEDASGLQAFGNAGLFLGQHGQIAITLGLHFLNEADIADILGSDVVDLE